MNRQKPMPDEVYRRDFYWKEIVHDEVHPLPKWAFDFVSIHPYCDGCYSLLSPICLVNEKTGERPDFEDEKFRLKSEAVERAKEIAEEHGLFVVDCV